MIPPPSSPLQGTWDINPTTPILPIYEQKATLIPLHPLKGDLLGAMV